ncbi:VWA domain-containing protein [uncultured Anaerococcus sp.]|uniref:VWA domain-containing protein n=1 Tax=uncultured Anaerococcus sp. TaxID=293428 RepID=UPI0025D2DD5D|nr:VWA domain-containing protein [uncultured Anaerococcus sp.]
MSENFEKIREYNIIWDFAKKYDFLPEKSYPMDEVYKNMTRGFVIRTFDFKILDSYFDYLRAESPFFKEFSFIVNLLMEDIAYKTLSKDNLVIESLRDDYAKKALRKYSFHEADNLKEQIEKPYYGKVLGKPIVEGTFFRTIYNDIFKIYELDTPSFIKKLNEVFKTYFRFEKSEENESLLKEMIKDKKPKDFKNSNKDEKNFDFSDEFIKDQFNIGSAEFTGNIYLEEKNKDMDRHLILLNADKEGYHGTNEFIEDFYGKSVFPEMKVKSLEKKLATEVHSGKSLYFTKGVYTDSPNAKFYKKNRDEVFDKNKDYIEKNIAINNRSIKELAQTIKNSIANYEDFSEVSKAYGIVDSTKAWKAEVLKDFNIFDNIENDDISTFKVDLLLDSSASQHNRQEIIANQAYIIEKAMDEVGIPIRVISFSTLRDHTVFNLFRDYEEKHNNKEIFKYFASGSNRDGLAFKVLNELIDKTKDNEKHIVIILSDGKPNDEKANINTIKLLEKEQYVGDLAVRDTAKEVRNVKNEGVSVLGVFTGEDEDLENAKLIYGQDFCRIKSIENFSKIVSIFMKNTIMKI